MWDKKANKMWNFENDCMLETTFECLKQQLAFDSGLDVFEPMTYDHISEGRIFMQCTGLKDKNGKLIYEGDIVKINENYCDYSAIEDFYINQNFVVEYFQPRAVYLLKPFEYKDNDGSGIYDLSPDFYEFLKWKPCGKLKEYTLQGIEVIGNIYENPELLEATNG